MESVPLLKLKHFKTCFSVLAAVCRITQKTCRQIIAKFGLAVQQIITVRIMTPAVIRLLRKKQHLQLKHIGPTGKKYTRTGKCWPTIRNINSAVRHHSSRYIVVRTVANTSTSSDENNLAGICWFHCVCISAEPLHIRLVATDVQRNWLTGNYRQKQSLLQLDAVCLSTWFCLLPFAALAPELGFGSKNKFGDARNPVTPASTVRSLV